MDGEGIMEIVHMEENTENDSLDTVSALHECKTTNARSLMVYNIYSKLSTEGEYDIGGTYSPEPDLWFYFTTTLCPGKQVLMNLFVCNRKKSNIFISVSGDNSIIFKKFSSVQPMAQLSDQIKTYIFNTTQENENIYIKSFCFGEAQVKTLTNYNLMIPIMIKTQTEVIISHNVVKRIKINHDFRALLSSDGNTDYIIKSSSGKDFPVHKIILAAHSAVLRQSIKKSKKSFLVFELNDKEIELLIEFLYTGTIKDVFEKDCVQLLEMADTFQLTNLFKLCELAIARQVTVENAVSIVVLAEKYKLYQLQEEVFMFIKDNPAVLDSDAWRNLDNLAITKKMFQLLYKYCSKKVVYL